MRIISGSHKGRHIIAPSNLPVHPTTDMAKTALFNILNSYVNIEDLAVLDLFAGTGNISYEFASRGCKSVTSVDIESKCTTFITSTAEKLNFKNIRVIKNNVFNYLDRMYDKFDLIFADPPYDLAEIESLADKIFVNGKSEILTPKGWLVIEHSKRNSFEKHPNFYQHRVYGKVNFSILINNE
jgi:16S rRNA (guanine(966)-N(2))-methyltransferase RsmD